MPGRLLCCKLRGVVQRLYIRERTDSRAGVDISIEHGRASIGTARRWTFIYIHVLWKDYCTLYHNIYIYIRLQFPHQVLQCAVLNPLTNKSIPFHHELTFPRLILHNLIPNTPTRSPRFRLPSPPLFLPRSSMFLYHYCVGVEGWWKLHWAHARV
jgi:hypothetical protein